MKKKTIKCVVAAIDSNGSSDFYFVKVKATQDKIDDGDHISAAKTQCEDDGYEAFLVYDQDDSAWSAFSRKAFDWKNAIVVEI